MEKNVAARRRAQQFSREGRWEQAAAELEQILQSGDVDPYDYVLHGDLLVRGDRLNDAMNSYEEAVSAYERVGLYRNAIAIAKKILRHDSRRPRTHWRLGDLYAKEGLNGDAVTHFFAFLDQSGGEATGEDFLETLERVSDLSGQRVEVALRLADFFVRAGRAERAGRLLEQVADTAASAGGFDLATSLRDRAKSLGADTAAGEEPIHPPDGDGPGLDGLAAAFDRSSMTPPRAAPCEDQPIYIELAAEEAAPEPDARGDNSPAPVQEPGWDRQDACPETPPGLDRVSDAPDSPVAPVAPVAAVEENAPVGNEANVPGLPLADDLLAENVDPRREWIDEALETGRPEQALALARAAHEEDTEAIWPLEKLVAACTQLGDTLGTIRYLTLLGDLLINEEDLEGSLRCFLRVIALDPENGTARRRLARFRDMGVPGADTPPEQVPRPEIIPVAARQATVAVRDTAEPETQDWFDLTTLLEEFRNGVRSQVSSSDYSSHYDLGVSHFEMGLFEEAIEEFDAILDESATPPEILAKAREMRGHTLMRLERYREAIHEFRAALDLPIHASGDRSAVRYQLACALEAAGDLAEARAIYSDLACSADPTGREAHDRLDRMAS